MDTLLAEIEAFLENHDLSAARFGREALGDKHFVYQLREGRRTWPETQARVRLYMATYQSRAA